MPFLVSESFGGETLRRGESIEGICKAYLEAA